jgi:hypothetical protein
MWFMSHEDKYSSIIEADTFYLTTATKYMNTSEQNCSFFSNVSNFKLRDKTLMPFIYEIMRLSRQIVSLYIQLSCSSLEILSSHILSKFNILNNNVCIKNLTTLNITSADNCTGSIAKMLTFAPFINHVDLTFGDDAYAILHKLKTCAYISTIKLSFNHYRIREVCAFNSLISEKNKLQVCIICSADLSFEYIQTNKHNTFEDVECNLSCELFWKTRKCAWTFLKALVEQNNHFSGYLHISHFNSVCILEMILSEPIQVTYLHFSGVLDHVLSIYDILNVYFAEMHVTRVDMKRLIALTRQHSSHFVKAVKFDEQDAWIKV